MCKLTSRLYTSENWFAHSCDKNFVNYKVELPLCSTVGEIHFDLLNLHLDSIYGNVYEHVHRPMRRFSNHVVDKVTYTVFRLMKFHFRFMLL